MRINAIPATRHGLQRQGPLDDIMRQPAPPHVSPSYWETCGEQERWDLLDAAPGSPKDDPPVTDRAWGGVVVGTGQNMLNHSRDIFTQLPAHLSQEWQFTKSPVTKEGGASKPLRRC